MSEDSAEQAFGLISKARGERIADLTKSVPFMMHSGLLTPEHYEKMGNAVWLFQLYVSQVGVEVCSECMRRLQRKETCSCGESTERVGFVCDGETILLKDVCARFGVSKTTAKRMNRTLRDEDYIETKACGKYGFQVIVLNSKRWYGKSRDNATETPDGDEGGVGSGPDMTPNGESGPHVTPIESGSGPHVTPNGSASGPDVAPKAESSGPHVTPKEGSGPDMAPNGNGSGPDLVLSGPHLDPFGTTCGPEAAESPPPERVFGSPISTSTTNKEPKHDPTSEVGDLQGGHDQEEATPALAGEESPDQPNPELDRAVDRIMLDLMTRTQRTSRKQLGKPGVLKTITQIIHKGGEGWVSGIIDRLYRQGKLTQMGMKCPAHYVLAVMKAEAKEDKEAATPWWNCVQCGRVTRVGTDIRAFIDEAVTKKQGRPLARCPRGHLQTVDLDHPNGHGVSRSQ